MVHGRDNNNNGKWRGRQDELPQQWAGLLIAIGAFA
jgi:hypothetical protein